MFNLPSPTALKRAFVTTAMSGFILAGWLPRSASAQGAPPPLPEEAFTACAAKSEGAACTVQFRDKEVSGTCATHPSDARLFCRLSAPPPPPPKE